MRGVSDRGRYSRRELLSAARVALISSVLVAVAYAGVVAVLDVFVSQHLTAQVDRQLSSRLALAEASPAKAFESFGIQSNGARYGLGIYGEPIGLWSFSPDGTITRTALGDPVLPAATRPPQPRPTAGATVSVDESFGSTTYRLQWLRTPGGWLLAAESLTEIGHVEAVLVVSEVVAFPFLIAAFFLVALAIGLRSVRPVEVARRRQLDFTADASHELRTPLSVIDAEVSLARSRPRTVEEYEAVLDRIGTESERLHKIVEDLLFLARADSEPSPGHSERVDLREVVQNAADRFSGVAESRSQRLEVRMPEEAGRLIVSAPREWLDRLAGTLLDNACRYSGDGSHIVLTVAPQNASRVVLRVEDDGPGIEPGHRAEVTARFKRASDVPGGHGLGLAIATSVVRQTGGALVVGASPLGGALVEASWPRSTSP